MRGSFIWEYTGLFTEAFASLVGATEREKEAARANRQAGHYPGGAQWAPFPLLFLSETSYKSLQRVFMPPSSSQSQPFFIPYSLQCPWPHECLAFIFSHCFTALFIGLQSSFLTKWTYTTWEQQMARIPVWLSSKLAPSSTHIYLYHPKRADITTFLSPWSTLLSKSSWKFISLCVCVHAYNCVPSFRPHGLQPAISLSWNTTSKKYWKWFVFPMPGIFWP